MLFFEKIIDCGAINIFGVVITTLSFVFAVIFYLKSRKTKKPCYEMSSINLLNSQLKDDEDIEIIYKRNKVKNLTATIFTFWNAGKETIDKSDVPESAPLTITGNNDIIIYSAEVVSMTDTSNQVKIDKNYEINDSNPDQPEITSISYIVTFDYLDQGQKGEIKILHSGSSDKDITITGKIKGAGDFIDANTKNSFSRIINYLFIFIFNIAFGAILTDMFYKEPIIPLKVFPYIAIILVIIFPITIRFFFKDALGYKISLKKVK